MTLTLFLAAAIAIAIAWNRLYAPRVPAAICALFILIVVGYEWRTLLTPRVDLPAHIPMHVYPWKAVVHGDVNANTAIAYLQIAPWMRIARDELRRGHLPLWNRYAASGAPLLANQQTAIFHPFTLLGMLLPLGKAFTLSSSLRLFTLLFFTFIFLRGWDLGAPAAIFGAVAYTFCTFHILMLLFPLGLSTMMLPVALVGVDRLATNPRLRTWLLLVAGLALSILGGHPESALWVWIVTAAYAVFVWRRVFVAATAFIAAMLLTAFVWYPTLSLLPLTPRYAAVNSLEANPADHGLTYEWLLPLLAPNILGTPQTGTYKPPAGSHPAILNDYGEVATGYAGALTLLLAFSAIFLVRRRPILFCLFLCVFSFFTFAEVPIWRDVIRAIPLAGVSLHSRLRIFWNLGICAAAALTVDRARSAKLTLLATIVVFAELVFVTRGYNPASRAEDLYPVTGAIDYLRRVDKPSRMVALGISFLPETPGYYGIEDVKTVNPISDAKYIRFLRGYLKVTPESYDLDVGDTTYPFFDFLNIRHVYAPPDVVVNDPALQLRYSGADGKVYENMEALPRYFFARDVIVVPWWGTAVAVSKSITDFARTTIVDRNPPAKLSGGSMVVREYASRTTTLDIDAPGWNLLATSEVDWPGWRATWNGRALDTVTVNGAFVGCYVPPGRGTLVLEYLPRDVEVALRVSILSMIALAIALMVRQLATRHTFVPKLRTQPPT